jgi:hypothetical protein
MKISVHYANNFFLVGLTRLMTVCLVAISLISYGQKGYKTMLVHQINVEDSTKNHISLIEKYDSNGILLYQKYEGYMEDGTYGKQDREYFYRYENGRLAEKYYLTNCFIDEGVDTTRILFLYDNNKLVKEVKSCNLLRTRSDYKGDLPEYPADYAPREWVEMSIKTINYDSRGFKKEEYTHGNFSSDQNRSTYYYDDSGKLIWEKSFADSALIWTENHEYGAKKNIMTRIWELEKDDLENGEIASWANPLVWKFVYDLDESGKVIKETAYYIDNKTQKEVYNSSKSYMYDNDGKLIVYTGFGEDYKPKIIHKFEYR